MDIIRIGKNCDVANWRGQTIICLIALLTMFDVRPSLGQVLQASIQYENHLKILTENDKTKEEFKSQFDTDEKLRDFRRLREFMYRKELEILELQGWYEEAESRLARNDLIVESSHTNIEDYERLLKKAKNDKDTTINEMTILNTISDYDANFDYTGPISIADIESRIAELKSEVSKMAGKSKDWKTTVSILNHNISSVTKDIRECESAINLALSPEYEQQEFRTQISGYFSGLIAILILGFFATLFFKAKVNIADTLITNRGLQFITLFVLIIAIILFGILGVLEGRELAAILAGISGYILGKGAKEMETDPQTVVP